MESRVSRRWVQLISALALAACTPSSTAGSSTAAEPAEPAEPVVAPVVAPEAKGAELTAASPGLAFEFSPAKLGRLEEDAKPTVESLAQLFPTATVREDESEGGSFPTLEVDFNGERALILTRYGDGSIAVAMIYAEHWVGPKGVKIGMSFAEVTARLGSIYCSNGVERQALCGYKPGFNLNRNIQYIFELDHDQKLDCESADCAMLADRELVAVRWH